VLFQPRSRRRHRDIKRRFPIGFADGEGESRKKVLCFEFLKKEKIMNKKIKILLVMLVLLIGSNVKALNFAAFRSAVQSADTTIDLSN
jgi:hypothetical protein